VWAQNFVGGKKTPPAGKNFPHTHKRVVWAPGPQKKEIAGAHNRVFFASTTKINGGAAAS